MEKNIFFSSVASYIEDPRVKHYCLEAPFDPPEVYPELPFIEGTNEDNAIYPMVRELLQQLRLDNGNNGIEL